MKYTIVPSLHSIVIIIICVALAGSFIFLSTRELNKEVQMISESVDVNNIYNRWKEPEYRMKQIDVSFQYDTRQVDDVHVVNYEISNEVGSERITRNEINVLLDCYTKDICDDVDISNKTEHLIKNYNNFIIQDDLVIVYGLYPTESEISFGEIESNVFVISENIFAKIVNPIFSETNEKYKLRRKNFLMDNVHIKYDDYLNEERIAKKEELEESAKNEISLEKLKYVKNDIELLNIIAESVSLAEEEN